MGSFVNTFPSFFSTGDKLISECYNWCNCAASGQVKQLRLNGSNYSMISMMVFFFCLSSLLRWVGLVINASRWLRPVWLDRQIRVSKWWIITMMIMNYSQWFWVFFQLHAISKLYKWKSQFKSYCWIVCR